MKHFIKAAIVAAGLVAGISNGYAQVSGSAGTTQKLAHLNSGDLLAVMPEMIAADASYQTYYKQKQSLLEQMDAERVKKTTTYNDKYKTLSEANKDALGKELQVLGADIQDLEKRIQDTGAKAEEDLKAKHDELYQPVFDKAQVAIKAVAKERGYAYVFDTNAQVQTILYFDGGEDILPLVKTKLGISLTAVPPSATAGAPAKAPATGVKKP